jgi:hypothetical protein
MVTTTDPFVGTWKLNTTRSEFDPNHRPSAATMTWETEPDGQYLMKSEGIDAKGQKVAERPQRFMADGQGYPVPGFPGLNSVSTRPAPNTIRTDVKREDGSLAGQAIFVVSDDGTTLTATNTGFDSQLRQFRQFTVWDRV